MPQASNIDDAFLSEMETAKEIVTGIRAVRAKKNLPNKEALTLNVVGGAAPSAGLAGLIVKLANLNAINGDAEKDAAAASFLVGTQEYNIPLANSIDVEAEKARINKEIAYLEGFLKSVNAKLSNERFVSKAPAAVIEGERRKQADAETKIATLRAALGALG